MPFILPLLAFAAKNVGGPVVYAVTSTFVVPVVLKKVSEFIENRKICQQQEAADPDLC